MASYDCESHLISYVGLAFFYGPLRQHFFCQRTQLPCLPDDTSPLAQCRTSTVRCAIVQANFKQTSVQSAIQARRRSSARLSKEQVFSCQTDRNFCSIQNILTSCLLRIQSAVLTTLLFQTCHFQVQLSGLQSLDTSFRLSPSASAALT